MNPNFRLHTCCFIAFAVIAAMAANGQSNLSPKQVKVELASSPWKMETIWNQKDSEGNDSTREWEITTIEDSRNYKDHFGVIDFQFFQNGTFKGTHYKGKHVEGKWSYTGGKKKGGPVFSLRFEAKVEDDGSSYPYNIRFGKLEFLESSFVAEGDICGDGCYQKVKFTKGK